MARARSLPYVKPSRASHFHFLCQWTADSSRGLQRSCVLWARPTWHLSPRLPHFLSLIPTPATPIFFSSKTPSSFWPRILAFALHSAEDAHLLEPPESAPTHHSDLSSRALFREASADHPANLTVSPHHCLSLASHPTYPFLFYKQHCHSLKLLCLPTCLFSVSSIKMRLVERAGNVTLSRPLLYLQGLGWNLASSRHSMNICLMMNK